MARAKPQTTKYPGVYKRETTHGKVYDIAYRQDGKVIRIKGKYRDLEAAYRRRIEIIGLIQNGEVPNPKSKTLEEFILDDWLPHNASRIATGKLATSTAKLYEADARNHLIPALGSTRLDRIDIEKIEALQDDLLLSHSPDSVRRYTNTLSGILRLAVRRKQLRTNPVRDVEKPEARRRTPELPTLAQVWALADAAPNETLRTLILVAAFTGARQSELFGLSWSNVDLTEGAECIRIVEQSYRGELKDKAKTPTGKREIPLAPMAIEALSRLSVAQQINGQHNPHAIVFPGVKGGYIMTSNFYPQWQKMRAKVGLPGLMFHTLRYFWISHVRSTGLASSVTEQLVGHEDERTHRGYTVPLPGDQAAIRAALAATFTKDENQ
jgi:integrase